MVGHTSNTLNCNSLAFPHSLSFADNIIIKVDSDNLFETWLSNVSASELVKEFTGSITRVGKSVDSRPLEASVFKVRVLTLVNREVLTI